MSMVDGRILTMDEDAQSRDALSLAVLEAAGRGDGRLAEAARKAHARYLEKAASGVAHTEAMQSALSVFHALGNSRR